MECGKGMRGRQVFELGEQMVGVLLGGLRGEVYLKWVKDSKFGLGYNELACLWNF